MLNRLKVILKVVWHWFKLILGISFLGGVVGMNTDRRQEVDTTEKWIVLIVLDIVFITIGLLILKSFLKNQIKANKKANPLFWQSNFYAKNPKLSKHLLKGSFNGMGSGSYTNNALLPNGSIERIIWLSIAHIPVVPLMQHRVSHNDKVKKWRFPLVFSLEKTIVTEIEKSRLDRKIVRYTYIFYYVFFIPFLFAPIVLFLNFREVVNASFPGMKFWQLLALYFIYGLLLMFLVDVWNNKLFLKRKARK